MRVVDEGDGIRVEVMDESGEGGGDGIRVEVMYKGGGDV